MKVTRLPDKPTPDRVGVKLKKSRTPKAHRLQSDVPMDYHGSHFSNPIWDERQLALIEEFKKTTRNDAK